MLPFKVMIVDDEILAIEHIKSIVDWIEFGFTIVGEAVTANQAILLANRLKPDVIFMDIRMPGTDGLKTSQIILNNNNRIQIVLLTSHRDFDYAKEAMNLGISTYLLKHEMNSSQLRVELKKLKKVLLIEREKLATETQHNLRILIDDGLFKEKAIEDLKEILKPSKGYILLYMKLDSCFQVIERNEMEQNHSILQKVANTFMTTISDVKVVGSVIVARDTLITLFEASSNVSEEPLRVSITHSALHIQQLIKEEGNTATVLLSPLIKKLEELPNVYKQLVNRSLFFLVYGRGKIFRMDDICIPTKNHEEWNELAQTIGAQSSMKIKEKIEFAFNWLKPGRFHPVLFKTVCQTFVHQLDEMRKELGMPSFRELLSRQMLNFNNCYDMETIKQWFLNENDKITDSSNVSSKYSKKVVSTMKYIHDNYKDELNIEMIGEALLISGDYIRHLFKKETGKTVLEYITWYRIEKAKELLQNDSVKVYEISEAVGYKTSQYFSAVFKKMTGMTPFEFKEGVANKR